MEEALESIVWIAFFAVVFLWPIGIIVSLFVRDFHTKRQMAHYWREKWENADTSSDTLVRASDAPQTPEAVLLRAAITTETPQEQLLRPST